MTRVAAETEAAPPPTLNENQRRSLSAGLQHVAGLLDEVDRVLAAVGSRSPFSRIGGDIRPSDAGVVRDYLDRIRRALLDAARRHGLDPRGYVVDAWRAIDVQIVGASISVDEMRPRRLRGYGPLDPAVALEVDRTCDELERAIHELQLFILGGTEEDYATRLARLGSTSADPELLATLERVIRDHGLVEFRALLRSILERLEERTFHVAVFGRVSSGKSSLLNALIGAPVLPVGVTPVTAVPTRVRVGSPPAIEVKYATGEKETIGIDALRSLASEEGNPGNVRRVARLAVVYPVPGLPEGVELVDTPGIGSLATSGASEAFAYLPRTDLALLLVDAASSMGPDEIGLLHLFRDAAIPVEVLLSKADLVGAADRERLVRYVRDTAAREAGMAAEVSPVSTVEAELGLVRAFAEQRLAPRFAERRELAASSVRRLSGRLLEGVTAALRLRLGEPAGRRPAATDAGERIRQADARIAEARADLEAIARRSEEAWGTVLLEASTTLLDAWRAGAPRHADPIAALRDALDAAGRRLREESVARLGALHASLREAALGIDAAAAELVSARAPGPDLAGLPVLDAAAILAPAGSVGRPLLARIFPRWSAERLARRLAGRWGPALHEALRVHGYRLRDFGDRAATKLAEAFHGGVAPFATASGPSPTGEETTDRGAIGRDLATLEAWIARREETPPA